MEAGGAIEGVARQYRDSANLGARLALHERFGSGGLDWQAWLFDQIGLLEGEAVLEAGCGPGTLWLQNRGRLPAIRLTLSDLSGGMVSEARATLRRIASGYAVAGAQALPFAGGRFDVVIANHMLYHLPDPDEGLAELRRVLRPRGRLVAATNGAEHMREVTELIERHLRFTGAGSMVGHFSLESGGEALERWFARIDVRRPPASPLRVTDGGALVDYVRSMGSHVEGDATDWAGLAQEAAAVIARRGYFEVTRDAGVFICRP